jgi:hypothetical protein
MTTKLPPADQRVLWRAVTALETGSFVARVSDLTGEPITKALRRLPKPVTRQINRAVQAALNKALDVALHEFHSPLPEPGAIGFKIITGVTGGVSGFFGLATLAVELPVTTTLMLRSIAGIARKYGEDLNDPAARLACLEVFALGPGAREGGEGFSSETSYYAIRAFLAKTVSEAAEALAERGLAQRAAPIVVELIGAVGSRFGLVVSEKFAAGALPVIGAVGAAAVNLAFMDHFQNMAHAHFAIRRLERRYGEREVVRMYSAYADWMREEARAVRARELQRANVSLSSGR